MLQNSLKCFGTEISVTMNARMLSAHHREHVKHCLLHRLLKFKHIKLQNNNEVSNNMKIRIMSVHYMGLQPLSRAFSVIDLHRVKQEPDM